MGELVQLGAKPLMHNRQAASLTVGMRVALVCVDLQPTGGRAGKQHVRKATMR